MNTSLPVKTLLLFLLISQCGWITDTAAQLVPTNVTLQNTTLQRGTHLATQTITVDNVDIAASTDVRLRAVNGISIDNGFSVPVGSTLKMDTGASVTPCTTSLCLDDVPSNMENTRFFSDEYPVIHPSLTVNGFDCGNDCDKGLGIKQVLEEIYNSNETRIVQNIGLINNLLSGTYSCSPTDRAQVRSNTQIMQASGLISLISYVLEKNGYDTQLLTPALSSADNAYTVFKNSLTCYFSWRIEDDFDKDAVKWSTVASNVARSIDLYLALENAYHYFDPVEYNNSNSVKLLSNSQKEVVLGVYTTFVIDALELLGGEYLSLAGLDGYDIQSGNWPLKVQTAIGSALLTWQDNGSWVCVSTCDFDEWVERAFKAAGGTAGTNRYRYWRYQSGDGQRWWAEGPYYLNFAVVDVLPFLHAIRINDLHNDSAIANGFIMGDPFDSEWFYKPLEHLAETATPDGKTPAIDDGNKHTMSSARLLAWTNDYGSSSIGTKFAWIANQSGNTANNDLLPVEIAIPKIAIPGSNPLLGVSGPASATHSSSRRQEVISRRLHNSNSEYYTHLKGEHNDPIVRGEGHEQGDQLQLLYGVDELSYLIDGGYDFPEFIAQLFPPLLTWEKSTWNIYETHNVMTVIPSDGQGIYTDGGVKSPEFDPLDLRVESDHQSVEELYQEVQNNVDILQGKVELKSFNSSSFYTGFADYRRRVLVINDPNDPYLIDINYATGHTGKFQEYQMQYNGNSPTISVLNSGNDPAFLWQDIYSSANSLTPPRVTNADLLIQPFGIEYPIQYLTGDVTNREPFVSGTGVDKGDGITHKRLVLHGATPDQSVLQDYTTLSVIKALPNGVLPSFARSGAPYTGNNDPLGYQYIVWPISGTIVDVMITWSSIIYDGYTKIDIPFEVNEANNFPLLLPQQSDYGYVRLINSGGTWQIDPNYQVNLIENPSPSSRRGEEREQKDLLSSKSNSKADVIDDSDLLTDQLGSSKNEVILQNHVITYPNPVDSRVTLELSLTKADDLELVIFDAQGREEISITRNLAKGIHQIELDLSSLAQGTYFLIVHGTELSLKNSITILR